MAGGAAKTVTPLALCLIEDDNTRIKHVPTYAESSPVTTKAVCRPYLATPDCSVGFVVNALQGCPKCNLGTVPQMSGVLATSKMQNGLGRGGRGTQGSRRASVK